MSLAAGTHLGSCEIISPLGVGGMGEVSRARDTKLGRDGATRPTCPRPLREDDFSLYLLLSC